MVSNRYPLIAREGWGLILLIGLLGGVAWYYLGIVWSIPFVLTLSLTVFVFRDPAREIPPMPLAIVAPVDGRVLSAAEEHDPYLDRRAIHVAIQMSPYGVYSARSPVEGKVLEPRHSVGGGKTEIPHGVWLQTDELDDVVMCMNRGPLNNAPRCYVEFGERVGQGQRCGFVYLGSRLDLYLPANCRIAVEVGDRVHAGADVLASLVHK